MDRHLIKKIKAKRKIEKRDSERERECLYVCVCCACACVQKSVSRMNNNKLLLTATCQQLDGLFEEDGFPN